MDIDTAIATLLLLTPFAWVLWAVLVLGTTLLPNHMKVGPAIRNPYLRFAFSLVMVPVIGLVVGAVGLFMALPVISTLYALGVLR